MSTDSLRLVFFCRLFLRHFHSHLKDLAAGPSLDQSLPGLLAAAHIISALSSSRLGLDLCECSDQPPCISAVDCFGEDLVHVMRQWTGLMAGVEVDKDCQ